MTNQPRQPLPPAQDGSGSLPDTQPFDSQILQNAAAQIDTQLYGNADPTADRDFKSGEGLTPKPTDRRDDQVSQASDNDGSSIAMLFSTSPASGSKPLTDSILRDIGYTPAFKKPIRKGASAFAHLETPLPRNRNRPNNRASALGVILSSGAGMSSPGGSAGNSFDPESDIGGPDLAHLFGGRPDDMRKRTDLDLEGSDGLEMTLSQIFHTAQSQAPNAAGFGSEGMEMSLSQIFHTTQSQTAGAGGFGSDTQDQDPTHPFPMDNLGHDPFSTYITRPITTLGLTSSSPLRQVGGTMSRKAYGGVGGTTQLDTSPLARGSRSFSPSQSQSQGLSLFSHHTGTLGRNSRAKSVDNLFSSFSPIAPRVPAERPDSHVSRFEDHASSYIGGDTQVLSQRAQDELLKEVKNFTHTRKQQQPLETPLKNEARDPTEQDFLETQLYPIITTKQISPSSQKPINLHLPELEDEMVAKMKHKDEAVATPLNRSSWARKSVRAPLPSTPIDTQAFDDDPLPTNTSVPYGKKYGPFDVVQVPMTSSAGVNLSPESERPPPDRATPSRQGRPRRKNLSQSSSSPTPHSPSSPSSVSSPEQVQSPTRHNNGGHRLVPDTARRPDRNLYRSQNPIDTPLAMTTQPRDSSLTGILIENTPVSTLRSVATETQERMIVASMSGSVKGYSNIPKSSIILHPDLRTGLPDSSLPSAQDLLLTQAAGRISPELDSGEADNVSHGDIGGTRDGQDDMATCKDNPEEQSDSKLPDVPIPIPSSPPVLNRTTISSDSTPVPARDVRERSPTISPGPASKVNKIRRPHRSLAEIAMQPSPKKRMDMSVVDGIILVTKEDQAISRFLSSVGKGGSKATTRRDRKGMEESGLGSVLPNDDKETPLMVSSLDSEKLKKLETSRPRSSASEVPAWMDSTLLGYGRRRGLKPGGQKNRFLPGKNDPNETTMKVPLDSEISPVEGSSVSLRTDSVDLGSKQADPASWRKPRTLKILTGAPPTGSPHSATMATPNTTAYDMSPLVEGPSSKSSSTNESSQQMSSAVYSRKRRLMDDVDSIDETPMRITKKQRSRIGLNEDAVENPPEKPKAPLKRGRQLRVVHSSTTATDQPCSSLAPSGGHERCVSEGLGLETNGTMSEGSSSSANPPVRMRVFALFRGLKRAFYPATFIGRGTAAAGSTALHQTLNTPTSAHSATYPLYMAVRFDDGTTDDIEPQNVRLLHLKQGDQVKVDLDGMRRGTYIVVRMDTPEQKKKSTSDSVLEATDAYGFKDVVLSLKKPDKATTLPGKGKRKLASKKGSTLKGGKKQIDEEEKTVTVPVTSVYLTAAMWVKFAAKASSIPWDSLRRDPGGPGSLPDIGPGLGLTSVRSARLSAPLGPHGSSMAESPAVTKGGHTLHTLVNPSAVSGSTRLNRPGVSPGGRIFSNMVIAVTHSNEGEKNRVQKLLTDNGCVLVEKGFEELFSGWGESISGDLAGKGNNKGRTYSKGKKGKGRLQLATIPELSVTSPQSHQDSLSSDDGVLRSFSPSISGASCDLSSSLSSTAKPLTFAALVSDAPCRRIKYMQALALGLPCLSPAWVTFSLQAGRVLPFSNFLLPAGTSSWTGGIRSLVIPLSDEFGGLLGHSSKRMGLSNILHDRYKPLFGCGVIFVRASSNSELTKHRDVLVGRVKELQRLLEQKELKARLNQDGMNAEKVAVDDGTGHESEDSKSRTSNDLTERSTSPPSYVKHQRHRWSYSDPDEESETGSSEGSDGETGTTPVEPKPVRSAPLLKSANTSGLTVVGNSFTSGTSGSSVVATVTDKSFMNENVLKSYLFIARAMGAERVKSCDDLEVAARLVMDGWRRTGDGSKVGKQTSRTEGPRWDCVVIQTDDISDQVQWIKLVKKVTELEHALGRKNGKGSGDGDDNDAEGVKIANMMDGQLAMLHVEVLVQSVIFGPRKEIAGVARDDCDGDSEIRKKSPAVSLMAEAAFYSGILVDV